VRFDRIRLRNFKPYADTDLDLTDGVTVIHGLNGSGKSSLLEACFFALYGSKALDGTLEDAMTTGADETDVELWFTHGGESFHITRELRRYGDSVSTTKCVLDGPDGTIEGATDVRQFVGGDLLRMDHEAFVNCAYVRQGEVNKLINASPSQRQDMLDDLLQLGKLEEYRERAGEARLGVQDVLADKRGGLNKLDEQIQTKEDQDLHARLNSLETKLNGVDDDIERFEENRENAESSLTAAEQVLEEAEEREQELSELDEQISDLEASVRETEREREALMTRITETRERIEERQDELEELLAAAGLDAATEDAIEAERARLDSEEEDIREAMQDASNRATAFENQSTNLGERAADLRQQATEKRERADSLETEASEADTDLADRRERLGEVNDRISSLEATFEDAPVDPGEASDHRESVKADLESVREEIQAVSGDLTSARDSVDEAERLLEEGKCPECGQPVDDSPHVDTLDEDRERVDALAAELGELNERKSTLDEKLSAAESLVDAESDLSRLRETREMLTERVDELEGDAADAREAAQEAREAAADLESQADQTAEVAAEKAEAAESARETVAEQETALDELDERREAVDAVAGVLDAVADGEAEIERFRERRESKAELKAERQKNLENLRERRSALRDEFDADAVEQAKAKRDSATDYLEKVGVKLEELREERDDLQSRVGAVENALAELDTLREERAELAETVASLQSLHDETTQLESLYGDLRAELRQRNVESLERMLNETFDLVYGNDAYSHIELDGSYELTVYQKDGTPLAPEQLSGGERALFNLSLRCAIYRLLSEGIEGAAPTPPLILDEPTVFLDSGHVSRLVDLVEEMRGFGVRQILIVSHDDELVAAADDLVTVEKDTTTNRSSVHREDAATLAAAESMLSDD
jgi:exonuclease SbcC